MLLKSQYKLQGDVAEINYAGDMRSHWGTEMNEKHHCQTPHLGKRATGGHPRQGDDGLQGDAELEAESEAQQERGRKNTYVANNVDQIPGVSSLQSGSVAKASFS